MLNRFAHIAYDEIASKKSGEFKAAFEVLDEMISGLPPGRPTSLALTKIEEAFMWVGKAIRDEQIVLRMPKPMGDVAS